MFQLDLRRPQRGCVYADFSMSHARRKIDLRPRLISLVLGAACLNPHIYAMGGTTRLFTGPNSCAVFSTFVGPFFSSCVVGATDRACFGDTLVGPAVPHAERLLLQRGGPADRTRRMVAEWVRDSFVCFFILFVFSAGRPAILSVHSRSHQPPAGQSTNSAPLRMQSFVPCCGCVVVWGLRLLLPGYPGNPGNSTRFASPSL